MCCGCCLALSDDVHVPWLVPAVLGDVAALGASCLLHQAQVLRAECARCCNVKDHADGLPEVKAGKGSKRARSVEAVLSRRQWQFSSSGTSANSLIRAALGRSWSKLIFAALGHADGSMQLSVRSLQLRLAEAVCTADCCKPVLKHADDRLAQSITATCAAVLVSEVWCLSW